MRQFANFKLNSANIMPSTSQSRPAPLGDMDPFRPNPMHAVRLRARSMAADTHFEPHRHDWAQLAYCASGTVQVRVLEEASSARQGSEIGYIVPPSRAVWIAPGATVLTVMPRGPSSPASERVSCSTAPLVAT